MYILLISSCLLCLVAVSVAQEADVVVGQRTKDGAIIAVDSDFAFMETKPNSLPPEANAGLGVFVKVTVPASEILCEYRGAIVSTNVQYESDHIYNAKTSTNEIIQIIPDMERPICSYINDCVVATPDGYTDSEVDAIERGEMKLKVYPGYSHNAQALVTKMGKVFIISTKEIPAGTEVFYEYGNTYWLPRLRQIDGTEGAEQRGNQVRQPALSSSNTLHLLGQYR